MPIPLVGMIAGPIIGAIGKIIGEAVEDKDLANRLTARIAERVHELEKTELQGAIDIIIAEATGSMRSGIFRNLPACRLALWEASRLEGRHFI